MGIITTRQAQLKEQMMKRRIVKRSNCWYADFMYQGKRFRGKLHHNQELAQIMAYALVSQYLLEQAGVIDKELEKFDKIVADPEPEPEIKPVQRQSKNFMRFEDAVDKFIKSFYKVNGAYYKVFGRGNSQAQAVTACLRKYHQHSRIKYVQDANYDNLMAFMDWRSETMNNNSMCKQRAFINKFFDYAENMDWIMKSDARKLPKYKHEKSEPYHFTDAELDKIMANAGEFKQFYQFLLYTGIRCTDVWEIARDAFYEPDNDGVCFIKFKMNKTGLLLDVPLSDKAKKLVESIMQPYYLFPEAMDRRWREAQMYNLKSNFTDEEFKEKGIKNHTFRHTFAMHQLIAGTPKEVIQQLMGHTSVRQTEVYANKLPKKDLIKWVK